MLKSVKVIVFLLFFLLEHYPTNPNLTRMSYPLSNSNIAASQKHTNTKQPSKFNPKIFFFHNPKKINSFFSEDSLKIATWKQKQEAEAIPLNRFCFCFHPKRPESALLLLLPLPHHFCRHLNEVPGEIRDVHQKADDLRILKMV